MGRYLDLVKQAPLQGEATLPRNEEAPGRGDVSFPEPSASLGTLFTPGVTTKTTETTKAPPAPILEPDDPEVAWRLEAMQRQIPPSGPIPDLIAREAPVRPGACFSCSDPLTANQHYRCRPCAVAAAIAIWGVCPEVVAAELARRELL